MEILLGLVIIILAVVLFGYLAAFLGIGLGYLYTVLSVVMVPVLTLLVALSALIGLVCAIKNAFKAFREMRRKG